MRLRRLTKGIAMLLLTAMMIMIFPTTANADTGPKPSVHISFENLGNEECWGTLLSSTESTGPASAWNGKEDDAQHNENPNGYYPYQEFGYKVWKAFVDYAENDDFFFLQKAWRIDETKELVWGYYPPHKFKILLYFPETGEFAVSDVYEQYAFDTYFTVNMDGVKLFVDYNEELSSDERINAFRSYNYNVELLSLVARIIVTILIEMAIALLFGFRRKKQLLLLIGVNTATQIILNVLLNIINYNSGALSFVIFYIFFEILVFVIEAMLYCTIMKRISERPKKNSFYVLYALIANAVSFGAGFIVAQILPGIF